jgi:bacterioferritin (cytochrome b1)
MATLTNKDKRIKQLENDLKQERKIIDTLKKRITTLEKRKRN